MNAPLTLLAGACLASATIATLTAQPAQAGRPVGQVAGQPAATVPHALPVPDMAVVQKAEVDGILIEDMKIGDGYQVQPGGVVVAHYQGTLKADGSKFDSTFERGEPIAFPLSGVIKGWAKGVPGMKVGGIRRLTIPAALAYGDAGIASVIPPKSDLVFVIQLVGALQVEDITVGAGEEATDRCVAVTSHIFKDQAGKEVERADASNPYVWVPGEFQPMQYGLKGMKPGGKRRLTIPKEMNISAPGANSSRPQNVALTMEFELIFARNLPGASDKSGGKQDDSGFGVFFRDGNGGGGDGC